MRVWRSLFLVRCFGSMSKRSRRPSTQLGAGVDPETYASLLRQCISVKALAEGRQVHSLMVSGGYAGNTYLGNLLVQMYGVCGSLDEAIAVFGKISEPNVFSMTIMVSAYIQNGDLAGARRMFDSMSERDEVSWNSMIAAYAQNGDVEGAENLFGEMPDRNVVSWTAMLTAYAQRGHLMEAKHVFEKMPQQDVQSWNAIVAAHAHNGDAGGAKILFDRMPERDAVSWNSTGAAYADKGDALTARSLFDRMPQWNVISWNIVIAAYAHNGSAFSARALFDEMPQPNVVSWNGMIAAYAQNGHVEDARKLFDQMPLRNTVSWNSMISAYARTGQGKDAIRLLALMDSEGLKHTEVTYTSVVDACAGAPTMREGRLIHASIVESGVQLDSMLGSALLNMYGKCGCLDDAQKVFDKMHERDAVSWGIMIGAYAQNGHGEDALEHFHRMDLEGVKPDQVTFISILAACSHKGMLSDGWFYFVSMQGDYEIVPMLDHYVCMIDLLGRAGRLNAAEDLVDNMPFEPNVIAWITLLSACRGHSNMEQGKQVARRVLELDPDNVASYSLLANIHAEAG